MPNATLQHPSIRFVGLACAAILAAAFSVLFLYVVRPFLEALLWALILVGIGWPAFIRLRTKLGLSRTAAAATVTLLFVSMFVVIVVPISFQLVHEARSALANGGLSVAELKVSLAEIPLVGDRLSGLLALIGDREAVGKLLISSRESLIAIVGTAVKGLTSFLFTLAVSLFATFFILRDGELLYGQAMRVLYRVGGKRVLKLFKTAHRTVRGSVYGTVVTALVQGCLAGVGFYVAGAPLPVLLGFLTCVMSFIPFGGPLVYLPVAGYLALFAGELFAGIGLAVWGAAVVSSVDNVLRPIFISHATNMPILLVFMGILGGIVGFGLLGLFVGPAIMAVALSLWREVSVSSKPRNAGSESESTPVR